MQKLWIMLVPAAVAVAAVSCVTGFASDLYSLATHRPRPIVHTVTLTQSLSITHLSIQTARQQFHLQTPLGHCRMVTKRRTSKLNNMASIYLNSCTTD